jgi:isoleucyl-tRNA synthetase
LKDRLYTYPPKSFERRSAQSAIYVITKTLALLSAPLLAFTADEMWDFLPKLGQEEASIHLAEFPNYDSSLVDADLLARWEKLFTVRDQVKKALESGGFGGGSSLKAKVLLHAKGEQLEFLRNYQAQLHFIFITSQAEVVEDETAEELQVKVEAASGQKCERCWHFTDNIGTDSRYPTVCSRCATNIVAGWGSN